MSRLVEVAMLVIGLLFISVLFSSLIAPLWSEIGSGL